MKGKGSLVFLLFFSLSLILFFLKPNFSRLNLIGKPFYSFFANFSLLKNAEVSKLKEENLALERKLLDQQKLLSENKALRDQFETASPKSLSLLPAEVIGAPKFLPFVSLPDTFILDKGSRDGVKAGDAVIYKNNLVGVVSKLGGEVSEAVLVISPNFKMTGRTDKNVLGVIKGQGDETIIFDNVLLSDTLSKNDLVLTAGDFPTGLVVGRIISSEKNEAQLFQKGKVESFLDFSLLQTVFIAAGLK